MTSDAMHVQIKKDIMQGSKSFSLASLFFDEKQRAASWQLYAWCRYCDDQVDHANENEILHVVEELQKKTIALFKGQVNSEHPWPAFHAVVSTYQIPEAYALDLIEGFKRDAQKKPIRDEADLMQYCYGVASAVGLMMCHIMSVSSSAALPHAVALGRAMQLTNIARDIVEDHKLGRLYLPISWLNEAGLTSENYLDNSKRMQLKKVIIRLLSSSDQQYRIGFDGLPYLPTRSAWAVASALHIYRAIGKKILKNTDKSLQQRTVVSKLAKFIYVVRATGDIAKLFLIRLLKPYTPTVQIELWRNS